MRLHPAILIGATLLAVSFNDILVYGIGEMTAIQDRPLRPVVAVMLLVVPGLALVAYGAFARVKRSGDDAASLMQRE